MEMRHELLLPATNSMIIVAEQVEASIAEMTVTFNVFHLIQLLDQLKKGLFALLRRLRSLSEIAQVHAGEHDLLHAAQPPVSRRWPSRWLTLSLREMPRAMEWCRRNEL